MSLNLNNKKLIFFTTLISGALPVAYLVTNRELKTQEHVKTPLIRFLGYLFSITTYLLSIFLVGTLVIRSGYFESETQKFVLAISIFSGVQIIMSSSFIFLCRKFYDDVLKFTAVVSKRRVLFYYGLYISLGILMTVYLFLHGPFFFTFSSIYLLANIYVHARIKPVFKSGRGLIIFTSLFVLIACMFPLGDSAYDSSYNLLSGIMVRIGYYYVPVLLYLFLIILALDFIKLIISRLWKGRLSWSKLKRYKRLEIITVAIIVGLIMIAGINNFNNTKVNKYDINVAKQASNLSSLKVAMLADCHFSEITSENFILQLVEKLNSMDADVVLFVGDIVESSRSNSRMKFIEQQLKQINSKYGVFAVEGNHEYYNRIIESGFFEKTNIQLLRDSIINIENSVQLVGRMDKINQSRLEVEEILNKADKKIPTIVLEHQPLKKLKDLKKADVYVSGHTHHGQFFPFNLITSYINELSWGYKRKGNTHYFVTSGAQGCDLR